MLQQIQPSMYHSSASVYVNNMDMDTRSVVVEEERRPIPFDYIHNNDFFFEEKKTLIPYKFVQGSCSRIMPEILESVTRLPSCWELWTYTNASKIQ